MKENNTMDKEKEREALNSLVKGLTSISIENLLKNFSFNETEKAQLDRARFTDEQAKKSSFVIGGQVKRKH